MKKLSVLSRPYLRRLSILPFSQMSTNFFLHSKRFTWLSRINCTESSPFYLDQRTWLVQDYAALLFCENVCLPFLCFSEKNALLLLLFYPIVVFSGYDVVGVLLLARW